MAFFCTFASGSSGNCSILSSEKVNVLIDIGISARKLALELSTLGLSASDISAVFITHEHEDHIRGLETFTKRSNATVYASVKTAAEIERIIPALAGRITPMVVSDTVSVEDVSATSFETSHDVVESVGYIFGVENKKIGYVTDLGFVSEVVEESLKDDFDLLILEANYDVDMLLNGPYPEFLKRRIMGKRGHISNDESKEVALSAARCGTKKIILAHLSRENNTPDLAYFTVSHYLKKYGCEDCTIAVAPRSTRGEVCVL